MTVLDCYKYVQERLNRLSSNKGNNIPKHSFVSAFNSVQLAWVEDRAKLAERNIVRTDEIQQLLKETSFNSPVLKTNWYEVDLPADYFHYKRSTSIAECELRNILVKEGDINSLLRNDNWKPSVEWGETLCTLVGNKLRVYIDNFTINSVYLLYYRLPLNINMDDGNNDVNGIPTTDVDPEFNGSSLIEILNMTSELLAADNADQWNLQAMMQRNLKHN